MKYFQLWLVFNSCIFMMVYFMEFLLRKYSKGKSLLICITAVCLSMMTEIFRAYAAFDVSALKMAVTIINILILQLTALVLAQKKDSYTLFIGFSSSIFVLAGNVSACAVLLLFHSYTAAMAVCTLANTAVFACMNILTKEICTNILSKEITIWMCTIPAMCYITFFFILYFPEYFSSRPESVLAAGSLCITVVVMYILLIQYANSKSVEKKLLWRNKELHAYIRGIELQTETVSSAISDFKIMRHDLRHKNQLLAELLHEKKYSEAEQVLHKETEYLSRPYLTVYCENTIINSILSGLAKQAEKMGISLKASCTIPSRQPIDDYDLAIVTANLLENAIQAAAKLDYAERIIQLTLKNRKNLFFIEVQNPCHGHILFSKKNGYPLSSQGAGHGYGMMSVAEFVKKYNAQFDCYIENETFIIRILIPFL